MSLLLFLPPPCHPAWLHSSPLYSPAGFSCPLLTHTMSTMQQILAPRVTGMGTPRVLFRHPGSRSQGLQHLPEPPRSTALRSLSHLILLRNHETTDTFSLAEEAWCGFMQIPLQRRSTRQNILKSSFQNHRWAGRQQSCVPMGRRPASPRLLVAALPLQQFPSLKHTLQWGQDVRSECMDRLTS